jgi:DNA-binding LacI/PurR family transcriptional regulator
MPCTLRDIARTAGVSTATASRVINEAANVSDHTRFKVLSAISRLKYIPDVHAAGLRRGKALAGGGKCPTGIGTNAPNPGLVNIPADPRILEMVGRFTF